ncbi:hypothetical protein [Limimaricola cinnabarinus]|uniref:hypothetical protein n=1 Tax=Limimaricola cinnabarinus TaxID=1125964 RepID=UPI002492AE48|nr:hypothetical protein [Limimaricola cinnabarinus]
MQIERGYTIAGRDPLAGLVMRRVTLGDGRGGHVPRDWPSRAARGLAAQAAPGAAPLDLRRAAERLTDALRARAEARGFLGEEASARAWTDEMRHMLAERIAVAAPGMWSGGAATPDEALPLVVEAGAAAPDELSRLAQAMRDGAPLELRFAAAPAAPRVVLDLGRFVVKGEVAAGALIRAVRVWVLALAVEDRPGALGLAGFGAALMRLGLDPAGREGRLMAAALAALAEAARLSAASELGLSAHAPRGAAGLERLRRAAPPAPIAALLDRATALRRGLSAGQAPEAPALAVSPLGAAAAILGRGPDPLAPVGALRIDVETPAGHRRAPAPELAAGLAAQGHAPDRIAAVLRHVAGHDSLAAAPGIDHAALRACGLDAEQIARIEAALPEARDLRAVITPWRLGRAFCEARLGLAPEDLSGHGLGLLERLGFDAARIERANRHVFGHGTVRGAPGITPAQAAAFDPEGGDARARLAMAAMLAGVIDGPVTALVAAHETATLPAAQRSLRAARRAGLAALVTMPGGAGEEREAAPQIAARLREIMAMLPPGARPGTAPAEAIALLDAAGRSRPEARRHARALRERLLGHLVPRAASAAPRRGEGQARPFPG